MSLSRSLFALLVVLCTSPLPTAHAAPQGLRPYDLHCDDAAQPLGIDNQRPRLGWKLRPDSTRARRQVAYRILASTDLRSLSANHGDLWDSGEKQAGRLPYAVYAGKPLASGQRVYWKVRARDERGRLSTWSDPAWFEMGLMNREDWRARWIARDKPQPAAEREMFGDDPAPLLRKEFTLAKPIASARIYVSGLGYYELRMNGQKIGDHVLDPGWTDYARRALYATYDVTDQLRQGRNAVGIMLGNGWYNPLPLRMWGHLNLRDHLTIGQPRAVAQIAVTFKDGTRRTIVTDGTWRWHDGPIRRNSVYLGEVYDARAEQAGWDRPGATFANDWRTVRIASEPIGALCAQTAPPIRVTRTLRPQKITTPSPGVAIVDMGQNFAGWVRLKVRGPAGTQITLRYGELLRPDGSLNPMTSVAGQIKRRRVEAGSEAPSTAWQRDIYTLKGDGEETYTPRFTFHGFRYVEVTGYPGVPTAESLTGLRLNSDVEPSGEFATSNSLYNRIHEITRWTLQSNLFSVQSDCPHREKFGYGGDIVAASEMAMLNFDMSRFYAKTVQDYADAARPDGGLTETAPFVGIADAGLGGENGPVEWGAAHPLLLLQLYRCYGNRELIRTHYPAAARWMRLLKAKATDGILDNGIGDHEGIHRPPTALSGTAFYYANAAIMAQLAATIGRTADTHEWQALSQRIRHAFQSRFDPGRTGRYAGGEESSQAFALYYDLVPPDRRAEAIARLQDEVLITNKGHLDTGIFGTKYLLNALSDAGRADIAATIVGQTTFPGWGYMLANGATTLWEHWEYSDNTFSHNHPMFGSVSEWLYKSVAGISPAPNAVGFDRVIIRPQPTPGLEWARASYRSVRGVITTRWKRRADGLDLDVTLPPGVTGIVTLPAAARADLSESGKPIDHAEAVTLSSLRDGRAVLQIGSGTYRFRTKLK